MNASVTASDLPMLANGTAIMQARIIGMVNYWVNGVLTNLVVVLGLIGNILTIIILSQRAMRSSTNFYLSALAVWDSIVLVLTFFLIGLKGTDVPGYSSPHAYVVSYLYPVALIAQTATIWLTVSFTVERYIAVCHPLKAASMCTISRAKIIIAGVSLGSVLYNIPRWFDFRPVKTVNPVTNETSVNFERTDFSQNHLYLKVYFSWLYVPMMVIVPLLLLSVLNLFLILAVRRSRRQRRDMNVRQSRENNITIMLVSVVIVFIICQVPASVYNLAFAINNEYVEYSFGYNLLSLVRNFLVTLNSAVNFILYCALGQKFRRIFLHIFFRKCLNESYIPMSGIHGQTTTVVTMAGGRGRVLCRTTLNHGSPGSRKMQTNGAGPSRTSQESSLMTNPDFVSPSYGSARKTANGKDGHTYAPKYSKGQESDQEEYDGKLDQLLSEQKNRNVFPLYKAKNGCMHR